MDFAAEEDQHGVRCTWQYWLASKQAQAKLAVPPACLVTLAKDIPNIPVLPYGPSQCRQCKAVINCHATVDFKTKTWACPLCSTKQALPQQYQAISSEMLPGELYPNMQVVEYQLPGLTNQTSKPLCLFVLDLCMSTEDMEQLKLSVEQAVSLLPEDTVVGMITFGSMLYVHEMVAGDIPRCVVCRGSRDTSKQDFINALGVGTRVASSGGGLPPSAYFQPLSECSFAVESILENMRPEMSSKQGNRGLRCTGAALSAAMALLEQCAPHAGGRAMLFTSGPCTAGPGRIVEPDLEDCIRTHKDLVKGTAKWHRAAVDFYDRLAERLVENGQCLDIFACALDQTGLSEMQHMVSCTGGLMVMAETFDHDVYRRSLARLIASDDTGCLTMGLNGTLEVQPSKHIAIRGAIGPLASLERKVDHAPHAEPTIGLGRTSVWKVNAIDASTTVAVFFEVTAGGAGPPQGSPLTLQFRTAYQHACGQRRLRVCTITRYWVDPATAPSAMGFDQDAAAVVMSRWAAFMAETEDPLEMSKWVDRQLISMCARYCDYSKARPETLTMGPDFSLYPEFIFHLRRSMFLDIFNNTPDETAFYRLMLYREPCNNCTLMLQPRLWRYTVDGGGVSLCKLDVGSIDPGGVMILDSWFCVVVHTGAHLAAWRNQGYFEDPSYAHIKEVVDRAHQDALDLVASRNPLPRLVVCDQNGSQARFLLVRLNPSRTHENNEEAAQVLGPDQVVYTDDVSYSVFCDQLVKLAVAAQ